MAAPLLDHLQSLVYVHEFAVSFQSQVLIREICGVPGCISILKEKAAR